MTPKPAAVPAPGADAVYERMEARWRELLNHADESDGTGEHVGFARYYRAKADGIAEAMRILRDWGAS